MARAIKSTIGFLLLFGVTSIVTYFLVPTSTLGNGNTCTVPYKSTTAIECGGYLTPLTGTVNLGNDLFFLVVALFTTPTLLISWNITAPVAFIALLAITYVGVRLFFKKPFHRFEKYLALVILLLPVVSMILLAVSSWLLFN